MRRAVSAARCRPMLERSFEAERRPPGRLRRRLGRLLHMSPLEIAHRALERAQVASDRRGHAAGPAVVFPRGSFKECLRRATFLTPPADVARTVATRLRDDVERGAALRAEAEDAL